MNTLDKKKPSSDSKVENLGLSILRDLRRITRAIDLNSKRLSLENNLTAPQVLALLAIYNQGALTIALIAEEIHLSSSTVVGIIDRLEAKGLVSRERSKTDRREVLVNISEEGKKIAKRSPVPLQEKLLETFSKLSELQQKNISKTLNLLVEMLDARELTASPILTTGTDIK